MIESEMVILILKFIGGVIGLCLLGFSLIFALIKFKLREIKRETMKEFNLTEEQFNEQLEQVRNRAP